jgi:2-dehydro-3-deoxygluconokinase
MAVLVPEADGLAYSLSVGGAEANVACALAALGTKARWVGRVGDDHFGRVVLRTLAGHGVDVSAVETDPQRQTGLYVKEIVPAAAAPDGGSAMPSTVMRYYRAGSAACAMDPRFAELPQVRDAAVLHLSGITAALSPSCAALVDALLADPRPGRVIAFDVNLRPALWAGRDPAPLLDLARRADLVFIGADEAEAICGVADPDALRRLLPQPRTLVVKQGADGAVGFECGAREQVPALAVEIAEPTGAGDSFAAGFIAAALRGLSLRDRLRLGALAASCALRVRADLGAMPDPASIERFLATGEPPGYGLEAAGLAQLQAGAA